MMMQPKLLDTVALLTQISQQRLTLVEADSPVVDGLPAGWVGTIVHLDAGDGSPVRYLVEFSDSQGCEYAMATLGNEHPERSRRVRWRGGWLRLRSASKR